MKNNQNFLIFSLFVFLLLFNSSSARGRLLQQNKASLTGADDIANLMGAEECDENDEECLQRRMIAEAHLDYIYTQNHKP
ncbi:hypothetical protein D8674_010889 [Pyrus ussuriensis x Pyrus communis]|uniref:Phytosulfokine n=1 Tax=Pyrus ussuriensis x Pyrus communis TaxID=2448454 RepID=A0A5N5G1Q9_9ROSA|nr:hypothetical protein D8674_010889 [Pyrus ussuriensis x Pyrus communis]